MQDGKHTLAGGSAAIPLKKAASEAKVGSHGCGSLIELLTLKQCNLGAKSGILALERSQSPCRSAAVLAACIWWTHANGR